jgi:hypothetical protein
MVSLRRLPRRTQWAAKGETNDHGEDVNHPLARTCNESLIATHPQADQPRPMPFSTNFFGSTIWSKRFATQARPRMSPTQWAIIVSAFRHNY